MTDMKVDIVDLDNDSPERIAEAKTNGQYVMDVFTYIMKEAADKRILPENASGLALLACVAFCRKTGAREQDLHQFVNTLVPQADGFLKTVINPVEERVITSILKDMKESGELN